MYLCPESKRESGRREYEARVFCSRVGPFVTWQVAARSYSSYRGLCSSRISSSRLFFRIRFRGQLRPHGVESGQLQRSEVGSRRHEGALPESAEGGQRDQRADGKPATVCPRSRRGVRHQAKTGRTVGHLLRRQHGAEFHGESSGIQLPRSEEHTSEL